MHEFVLGFFNFLRSFLHFMKIVIVFLIMIFLLYWIQNLTQGNWAWMGFFKPFFDWLLVISHKICAIEFNLFGAVFELKYVSATIILIAMVFLMHFFIFLSHILEGVYRSAHFVCKKTEEVRMNKALKEEVKREEKKLKKYTVTIHTKEKTKFSQQALNVNMDEQNKLMNNFVSEKTGVKPMMLDGGYMYNFSDFEKIDTVLDILFKLIHSNAPISYAICIQIGDNLEQLKKLIELKNFGKITMLSDTSYRYSYNEEQRYQTSQIGIFQSGIGTIEVHEFKEIL